MAQRDRYFWFKVLMVTALALLVGDVLALTCVVGPLAAPREKQTETPAFSARLTQSAMDQALNAKSDLTNWGEGARVPLPMAPGGSHVF